MHIVNSHTEMPGERDIEAAVTQLVTATLGKNRRHLAADDSVLSLRDHFDSFALLELVLQLEEAFAIHIGDDELDPDYFESIRTISAFVEQKVRRRPMTPIVQ